MFSGDMLYQIVPKYAKLKKCLKALILLFLKIPILALHIRTEQETSEEKDFTAQERFEISRLLLVEHITIETFAKPIELDLEVKEVR
jgi:hypothetical protein